MPYADARHQLNLKLTDTEYLPLKADATAAGVEPTTYARHLVVQRAAPPLSPQADAVREHYLIREQVWRELLDKYSAAAQQLPYLQQQIQQLQEQLRVLAAAKSRQDLLDEIPALFRKAMLPSLPEPTMPPDPYAPTDPA